MQLTNQLHPTPEQFKALVANFPKDKPIVMINIIRHKAKTGNGEETGEEAYARYGLNTLPFLKEVGGRLLWRGDITNTVIGDTEGQPQVVFLVEYPTVQNFINMVTNPEYIKIAKDRTLGLEYGGLLASNTVYNGLKG